ncbi:CDP-glycerol glycerophosphotransferase family protein [Bacillus velezensis]|uniref:CDP-glycerol glycerophosphotransferase family protein n=1 Tax=Bacillus halotolerans TaxID=260554 RepID=UPI0024C166D9|nr:CDP-glycerol glycerophosphotransferase family protein [Bacillus halotolerans]WHY24016.1 CDP-glycerol glycerophosphotransferase family protein [Bacillus halotolerans]
METGYPRNDILYSANKESLIKKIKQELGIGEDKKIILYAPTSRDNEFYESWPV